jgi:hypothetical protein
VLISNFVAATNQFLLPEQDIEMEEDGKKDHDMRDYALIRKVDNLLRLLNLEELKGAHTAISIISSHLSKKHFDDKVEMNVKALVKTFEELDEIGIEILHHEHQ